MQRDLRGQREAAFGDLSERAARKDTGHGITFFRICTSIYRIYVICMAFLKMPCGEYYMLGFHPLHPEHSITFSGNCTFTCCVPENDALHHSPT